MKQRLIISSQIPMTKKNRSEIFDSQQKIYT